MMGIALGGIGVVSLRLPFTVSSSFIHLLDLPSIILATFLVAILASIAYFTNPTEASFRAFLTELAFRQHLSRLSDLEPGPDDDELDARPNNATRPLVAKQTTPPAHAHGHSETPIVFHFANKASVSLRTPGYHFRSFAVLTFAIVSPVELTPLPHPGHAHTHAQLKPIARSNSPTHGAWFIGAFGRWWLGLEMSMHSRPVRFAAYAQDPAHESESVQEPHKARRSPGARTKAALREKLSLQTRDRDRDAPPRPTTPPPLPKSASLPLHTKRTVPPSVCAPLPPQDQLSSQDQSPIISDILKQLDAARSANSDLHAQLTAFHEISSRAHSALQSEVDVARATKKREDAGRAEVKVKTKFLDDARRQADGSKREAEKKLKAAAAARDGAEGRIERLGREVDEMARRMVNEEERVRQGKAKVLEESEEMKKQIGEKREEMRVTEEVVQALVARARELEGMIVEETERLKKMKEGRKKRDVTDSGSSPWPPPLQTLGGNSNHGRLDMHPVPVSSSNQSNDITTKPIDIPSSHSHFRPFAESPISPRPLVSPDAGPMSPLSASFLPSSLVKSIENAPPLMNSGEPFYANGNGHQIGHGQEHEHEHNSSSDYFLSTGNVNCDTGPFYGPLHNDILASGGQDMNPPVEEPGMPVHVHFDRVDSQRAMLSPPTRRRSPSPIVAKSGRKWFKGLNPDAKVFTLPSHGRPALRPGPRGLSHAVENGLSKGFHSNTSANGTYRSNNTDPFHPNPSDVFEPAVNDSFSSDTFRLPPNSTTTTSELYHSPSAKPDLYQSPPIKPLTDSPPPRLSVAGSFFSSLHNAFAPSPAERAALQRALGSGNTSLEMLTGGMSSGNGSREGLGLGLGLGVTNNSGSHERGVSLERGISNGVVERASVSGNVHANLERVSSHGSSPGSAGSSPHWTPAPTHTSDRSFFNPWAWENKKD